MNSNFRSTRDEFVEIESRWRLLSSREAMLVKRERDVRAKEEEIRQFMSVNQVVPMPMQMPRQMPMTQPSRRPQPAYYKHNRNHKRKGSFKTTHDKDYAQFADKTETKTNPETKVDLTTDDHESS